MTFVLRSTVLPGTVRNTVIPILESTSEKKLGHDLNVLFHPEFLRESTSVDDFYDPPKIVIGEATPDSSGELLKLYRDFSAPLHVTSLETAEMVKYSDNLFHALKVTFANEIGILCHKNGITSHEVMEVFCTDTKLNIAPTYLRPGFAFGGSCLPKDLRAFLALARASNVRLPMLEGILPSNQSQIERAVQMVMAHSPSSVGFYGLAFKNGTDDLRESPLVELAERLLGKGCNLRIVDSHVQIHRLIGENKTYIDTHFPHLAKLMYENEGDLVRCDTIILGHNCTDSLLQRFLQGGSKIIDLTGKSRGSHDSNYVAIV